MTNIMTPIFLRKQTVITLALMGTVALSACQKPFGGDVRRADTSVNAIDGTGLSDIMLNAADPAEAVSYF
eukprot:gene13483-biopygen31